MCSKERQREKERGTYVEVEMCQEEQKEQKISTEAPTYVCTRDKEDKYRYAIIGRIKIEGSTC